MNPAFKEIILSATGADSIMQKEVIQRLWSGYGEIVRLSLDGAQRDHVVIKHVKLNDDSQHPRGWNTDLSHQRKLHSYEVETAWYMQYAGMCDAQCRIPQCLAIHKVAGEVLMVLEDLDASGFDGRRHDVSMDEIHACLRWLAQFHGTFMGVAPQGLWPIGTYWHLDTRPDELEALTDIRLKGAANALDTALREAPYLSLVHGDAKLANFCFSNQSNAVAALDFQYVGGGVGMKDVAYFIGSCLHEDDCETYEAALLDVYFKELEGVVSVRHPEISATAVEDSWRSLYHVAWTDFHRFIKGWSPGHWKIHSYSERVARQVLDAFERQGLVSP